MALKMRANFLSLNCSFQTYAWGKKGRESKVAQLVMSNDTSFKINEQENYAELWVGTHPKGPSTISYPPSLKGTPLSVWLNDNQWALGEKVSQTFDGNLPFLFKVLSVNKALSIQAHPTKDHAQLLHSSDPAHYPDPNHKPEMVITVSPFKGLCGFRMIHEIKAFLLKIPELQTVLGSLVTDKFREDLSTKTNTELKSLLKMSFTSLMNQHDSVVSEELRKVKERFERKDYNGVPIELVKLFLQLYSWYPGDVGCWACFFLNYFQLEEGQSLFLAPNEPHAYISGDVVECMALSDNVVRAGLTPKYKDKTTLCSMLTYTMRTPSETLFSPSPHPLLSTASIYDPPTPEFTVVKIEINGATDTIVPIGLPIEGPSIVLAYSGEGMIYCNESTDDSVNFGKGSVYFIPAGNCLHIKTSSNAVLYHAYCSL